MWISGNQDKGSYLMGLYLCKKIMERAYGATQHCRPNGGKHSRDLVHPKSRYYQASKTIVDGGLDSPEGEE